MFPQQWVWYVFYPNCPFEFWISGRNWVSQNPFPSRCWNRKWLPASLGDHCWCYSGCEVLSVSSWLSRTDILLRSSAWLATWGWASNKTPDILQETPVMWDEGDGGNQPTLPFLSSLLSSEGRPERSLEISLNHFDMFGGLLVIFPVISFLLLLLLFLPLLILHLLHGAAEKTVRAFTLQVKYLSKTGNNDNTGIPGTEASGRKKWNHFFP